LPPDTKRSILIIDDDENLCSYLTDYFSSEKLDVLTANSGKQALDICSRGRIDVVLLDQRLPDALGHDLCVPILNFNDQTKIIFITAYPSFENALKAIKSGAYDYLSKPFELEEISLVIARAIRTLDLEGVVQLQGYKDSKECETAVLVGNSDAFADIKKLVDMSASSDAAVLITGETGTGKNVVARSIHYNSPVRRKSFVSLNCAALPENLIEAELFGYEKGAFTGATETRKGVFEVAEGGTIFLDEIGEMPTHLQVKLLSVLDDKMVKRLGGRSARSVDVRIIAATNLDLRKAIEEKRFREDLYYRLSVLRIHLPPLRDRREDIPGLCRHLIMSLNNGREITIPEAEIALLREYDWPGNVRELKNVVERAIILHKGNIIRPSELLGDSHRRKPGVGYASTAASDESGEIESLEEVEIEHIKFALKRLSGNYSRTARALGVSLSTLKRKIKDFGIH
jgi:DNA-binding NtrC family response regulator